VSDVSCCTSDLSESLSHKTQPAKKRVSEVIGNSSTPQRHEKWIRARKKSSGEYMSEETGCMADKIVCKMHLFR